MDISAHVNIGLPNYPYANPDNAAKDAQKSAAPQAAVPNPDAAGVAVAPVSNKESKPKEHDALTQSDRDMLNAAKSVVFEYDKKSGETVVKFMDEKGHVVAQTPPEQYLKFKQMAGGGNSLDIQSVEGDTKGVRITGVILDQKV